jgi:predicted HD superfamily hydrolase involved in NAD metabolism
MPDVSSTELRSRLALGEPVAQLIAGPVEAYIRRRGLYGTRRLEVLRRSLSPERFAHTLAVARLAEALARRWGLDPSRARLAGLLHDCGRSLPVSRMSSYARRRRLKVPGLPGILRHNPLLLHAYISADLALRRFSVQDPLVLNAIRSHTLGARRMSPLDRLLYIADSASEDRGHAEATAIRARAFQDLDEAFRAAVHNKIRYALSSGSWLHPLAVSLWNSLQE